MSESIKYIQTTFGEWEKTTDITGKKIIYCENCKSLVVEYRTIRGIDIKDCPRCGKILDKNFEIK